MLKYTLNRLKSIVSKNDQSPLRIGKHKKYIFIHINKTGGTSVTSAIGLSKKSHYTVKEVIALIGSETFDKAYVFTIVRNPWSKVVSHYKYRVKTNQTNLGAKTISFKQWVSATYGVDKDLFYYDNPKMFAPQVEWLKDGKGAVCANDIIKFETLNKDFERVAKVIGVKFELPHLNATKNDSYQDYYDDDTIEIVRNHFREDIELFDYYY
jgi:chondroitin 4-sulfotransferase 11